MWLRETDAGITRGESDQATRLLSTITPREGVKSLRVLIHDFAGHPFQIDLSRALAARGHVVQHVYCGSYTSGKGRFDARGVANLSVVPIPAGESFARYSPMRRISQEAAYGRRFIRVAALFRPDVVLACNVPLVAKSVAASWCRREGVPWVFWLQDLHSVAMSAEAERRAGRIGRRVGCTFEALERRLLRQASGVVSITERLLAHARQLGRRRRPLHGHRELGPAGRPARPAPRQRRGAGAHGLGDRFVYLYTGTLGLKHRPELLYRAGRGAGRRRRRGRHLRGHGRGTASGRCCGRTRCPTSACCRSSRSTTSPTSSVRPTCWSPCSSRRPARSPCRPRC